MPKLENRIPAANTSTSKDRPKSNCNFASPLINGASNNRVLLFIGLISDIAFSSEFFSLFTPIVISVANLIPVAPSNDNSPFAFM